MDPQWLEDIPISGDRDRLNEVLASHGAKLSGPAINIEIGLPSHLSVWQENMAIVFNTKPSEITEACLRVGQYIFRVYPRAADAKTCLVRAIINDDFLRARSSTLADLLGKYHREAKTMTSTLAFKGNFSEPSKPGPIEPMLNVASQEVPVMNLDAETFAWPESHDTSWPQPMPADVVQWLWTTAEARSSTPQDLIKECVDTAAWLDTNFTSAHTTLREALLAKVVALDRLGQELGQILSALETWSADWPQISQRYYYRFSKYLTPKEES